MKERHLTYSAVCALLLATHGQAAGAAFQPASTNAEIALDRILKVADADEQILDNLFHRYPDRPVPHAKRVNYATLFTSGYLKRLVRKQRDIVKKDCGGTYLNGQICGLDYNPITCTQDVLSAFEYETVAQTAHTATIIDPRGDRYEVVSVHGVWKLDDVVCSGS